jgi:uncharacterized protein (TIGR02466 family)
MNEQTWNYEWDLESSGEQVNNQKTQNTKMQLEQISMFPTSAYVIKNPNFLETVSSISDEYIQKVRDKQPLNELYPVYMSDNYSNDERLKDFTEFVGSVCWNVLESQGYAMNNFGVAFNEMWTQQHYKHSMMEQHTHGFGSVISGFYFLQCPEGSSHIIFHDPRPAKVITNLPEKDATQLTHASLMMNIKPEPGLLVFTNSWVPHSFTKHAGTQPLKFVHFNLSVIPVSKNIQNTEDSVEII